MQIRRELQLDLPWLSMTIQLFALDHAKTLIDSYQWYQHPIFKVTQTLRRLELVELQQLRLAQILTQFLSKFHSVKMGLKRIRKAKKRVGLVHLTPTIQSQKISWEHCLQSNLILFQVVTFHQEGILF